MLCLNIFCNKVFKCTVLGIKFTVASHVLKQYCIAGVSQLLLLTIRLAMPSVLRFLVCAGAIYVGFVLCGWLVLGPYHLKFRTLSLASETLFAMMNGDEVYMTFANMTHTEGATWWFSRAFFYLFVSLFIYVVVSVFISLLMDSYETVKVSVISRLIGQCQCDIWVSRSKVSVIYQLVDQRSV